jgi:hypothetical protein
MNNLEKFLDDIQISGIRTVRTVLQSPELNELLCKEDDRALRDSTEIWLNVYGRKMEMFKAIAFPMGKKDFKEKELNPLLVFVLLGTLRFIKLHAEKFKKYNEDIKCRIIYNSNDVEKLTILDTPFYERTQTCVVYEDSCEFYLTTKNNGVDKILLLLDSHLYKPLGKWEKGGMKQVK